MVERIEIAWADIEPTGIYHVERKRLLLILRLGTDPGIALEYMMPIMANAGITVCPDMAISAVPAPIIPHFAP